MMRRSTMSLKTMVWIYNTLKEAFKDGKNMIRRWKTKDNNTKLFCTRKLHDRYMSILSLNGTEISVIIILEMALIACWNEIAFKIARFIKCYNQLMTKEPPRTFKKDYPFAKAVRESKWQSNTLRKATVTSSRGEICITNPLGTKNNGLFKRCIVGSFGEEETKLPSLSDIRR